jgi:uncharacterized protein YciI
MATKYVLFYESDAEARAKAPAYLAEHSARGSAFHDRGELMLYGPFTSPGEGAMSVFRTREAAEEFARGDPFVLNGIVQRWHVREWLEAFSD